MSRGGCDCTVARGPFPTSFCTVPLHIIYIHTPHPFQVMFSDYFGTKWSLEDSDGIFMRTSTHFAIEMMMLHIMLKALPAEDCSALVQQKGINFLFKLSVSLIIGIASGLGSPNVPVTHEIGLASEEQC